MKKFTFKTPENKMIITVDDEQVFKKTGEMAMEGNIVNIKNKTFRRVITSATDIDLVKLSKGHEIDCDMFDKILVHIPVGEIARWFAIPYDRTYHYHGKTHHLTDRHNIQVAIERGYYSELVNVDILHEFLFKNSHIKYHIPQYLQKKLERKYPNIHNITWPTKVNNRLSYKFSPNIRNELEVILDTGRPQKCEFINKIFLPNERPTTSKKINYYQDLFHHVFHNVENTDIIEPSLKLNLDVPSFDINFSYYYNHY